MNKNRQKATIVLIIIAMVMIQFIMQYKLNFRSFQREYNSKTCFHNFRERLF